MGSFARPVQWDEGDRLHRAKRGDRAINPLDNEQISKSFVMFARSVDRRIAVS